MQYLARDVIFALSYASGPVIATPECSKSLGPYCPARTVPCLDSPGAHRAEPIGTTYTCHSSAGSDGNIPRMLSHDYATRGSRFHCGGPGDRQLRRDGVPFLPAVCDHETYARPSLEPSVSVMFPTKCAISVLARVICRARACRSDILYVYRDWPFSLPFLHF